MTNFASGAIAQKIAVALMRRLVRRGRLRLRFADGETAAIGDGDRRFGEAAMTLHRPGALLRMLAAPDPLFLSGFVDGAWDCVGGELEDLLFLLVANAAQRPPGALRRAVDAALRLRFYRRQFNPIKAARRRVAHHYDLGDELYLRFLDPDYIQYSCAFFDERHTDLAAAQRRKIDITTARLRLGEQSSLLDIGGGWGGLSREITRRHRQVRACAITLSERQFRFAEAARKKLPEQQRARLRYRLADYREHRGEYDRVVSVGMFEHVGLPQYRGFFRAVRRLLVPGGIAVLHTIVRPRPGICSPWLDQNIFPGGYIPAASQTIAAVEKSGLLIEAVHLHSGENYRKTLRAWRDNYRARRAELPPEKYDAKFHRMWEMYLAAAIHTFDIRQDAYQVMQLVMHKQ